MSLGESGKLLLASMKSEGHPDYEFEHEMHSMSENPAPRKGILS